MWFLYALISAFSLTGRNIFSKFNVDKTNEYVVMWATVVFAFPIAALAMLFSPFVVTDARFWPLLFIRIILDTVAFIFFYKALKFRAASYVIPIMSLFPALTIVTSFLINGQRVGTLGIIGVLITCGGSYALFAAERRTTKIEDRPHLKLATVYILITTIIYGILDPVHAYIIGMSNTYTYFFISEAIFVLLFTGLVWLFAKRDFMQLFKSKKKLVHNGITGLFLGVEVLVLFLALSSAPFVSYVSAIKMSSVGLTAVFAYLFLKEQLNRTKITAIVMIIVGVVVMVLG